MYNLKNQHYEMFIEKAMIDSSLCAADWVIVFNIASRLQVACPSPMRETTVVTSARATGLTTTAPAGSARAQLPSTWRCPTTRLWPRTRWWWGKHGTGTLGNRQVGRIYMRRMKMDVAWMVITPTIFFKILFWHLGKWMAPQESGVQTHTGWKLYI